MSVESINITEGKTVPLAQARLPAAGGIAHSPAENKRKEREIDASRMKELAVDVQRSLKIIHNVDLDFSVHETSGQIMITVMNEKTGEVIREIPPREILNLAARLDEMIGLIFDQKG